MLRYALLCLACLLALTCNRAPESATSGVQIAGAMRNVMMKGELGGVIALDTIGDRNGLYGIGPVSYLKGELLINDGVAYRSFVTSDSTMATERTYAVTAPFFVYGNVTEWETTALPPAVKSAKDLEDYVTEQAATSQAPFFFKLNGRAKRALIHVQNLADGSTVSSPAEAHRGQVNYELSDRDVEIVGVFSRKHQGVFTHHDSFVHLHLITADERMMGHLDELEIATMELSLPK